MGIVRDNQWRTFAACLDVPDPEIFFWPDTVDKAKAYCLDCPVIDRCLSYAESLDSQGVIIGAHGIWGGLTEKERREKRRQRRVA